jgi:hypothetical protein
VLDEEERAYLASIYFEQVHGRNEYTYYNFLYHLAREAAADGIGWRALSKISARIRAEFGEGFVPVTDFFSYRRSGVRLFPSWHQDGEFWLADDGTSEGSCGGFNLWILLDHREMPYSFDVLDTAANGWMYDGLYERQYGQPHHNTTAPKALFRPDEFTSLSKQDPHTLRGFMAPGETRAARASNVPLESGDALVLRQVEIHRTDVHVLSPTQWRLALGFKVLRALPVVRPPNPASPWGYDADLLRLRWPGILPTFTVGRELPLVYNRTAILALDARAQRPPWLAFALSDAGLSMLVPIGLLAGLAASFVAAQLRKRWRRGARARGDEDCMGLLLPGARGVVRRGRHVD